MNAKRPSNRPSLPVFFALTLCVLLTVCVPSSSTDQPGAANSAPRNAPGSPLAICLSPLSPIRVKLTPRSNT